MYLAAMCLFQGFLVCEWIKMYLKAFMYEHSWMHQGWLQTQGGGSSGCVCAHFLKTQELPMIVPIWQCARMLTSGSSAAVMISCLLCIGMYAAIWMMSNHLTLRRCHFIVFTCLVCWSRTYRVHDMNFLLDLPRDNISTKSKCLAQLLQYMSQYLTKPIHKCWNWNIVLMAVGT